MGSLKIEFLGHTIGKGISRPLREKLNTIQEAETPTTKKQVHSFLGLVNYYAEFIPREQELASPLHELTTSKSQNHVAWSALYQNAFESLKKAIGSYPILRLPDIDLNFILRTNASKEWIGAVLLQKFPDGEFPVAYWNRKLRSRIELYYSGGRTIGYNRSY